MRSNNPPPTVSTATDTRTVAAILNAPQFALYNPTELHFADAMRPPVPGGVADSGLMQVAYDHQPKYDRNGDMAGPVRDFFRSWFYSNRVRHV